MTFEQFKSSVSASAPPAGLTPALLALWHDARGDWNAAHRLAQDIKDRTGAWVHAYLHRKEGDLSNAGYWYRIADRTVAVGEHSEEWAEIAGTLLRDE